MQTTLEMAAGCAIPASAMDIRNRRFSESLSVFQVASEKLVAYLVSNKFFETKIHSSPTLSHHYNLFCADIETHVSLVLVRAAECYYKAKGVELTLVKKYQQILIDDLNKIGEIRNANIIEFNKARRGRLREDVKTEYRRTTSRTLEIYAEILGKSYKLTENV